MKVAVLIPVHNRKHVTMRCLERLSVLLSKVDHTFIVIDDGSTDGTSHEVQQLYPEAVVLHGDGNLWWTGAIEKGRQYAVGLDLDYILLVNDDLVFDDHFFDELIEHTDRLTHQKNGHRKPNHR